jgi:hypothetical protein
MFCRKTFDKLAYNSFAKERFGQGGIGLGLTARASLASAEEYFNLDLAAIKDN